MKQTTVEWMVEQFDTNEFRYGDRTKIIEQAKQMEKEQHDKTAKEWWKEGAHYMESGGRAKWESFEQYYNETYSSGRTESVKSE